MTLPATPLKCAGAPLKMTFMVRDRLAQAGTLGKSQVTFYSAVGNVFGVKPVNDNVVSRWKDLGIGVEYSPLTWAIGWLRTRRLKNVEWRYADLWSTPLGKYDVVYAFLSPAPMPELWRKVQAEMPAGSLFVSNSFAVPDVTPSEIVEVGDGRQTQLYCYRL